MKKFFLIFIVAMTVVALTAPAMADMKVTTKGSMEVNGIMMKNYPIELAGNDARGTNSWYSMEMIIEPTFHINDKVRIHNQIRIMERNYSGTYDGDIYEGWGANVPAGTGPSNRYSVFGDNQNNFWWERCYLSFPLLGGTLYVGRMSGGDWGHTFADDNENRDRIKYVRKFGHIVLLGVIEKREEGDGGTVAPRFAAGNAGSVDALRSASDEDGYAIGGIIPFSKGFIWRPLVYWIHGQGLSALETAPANNGNRERDIVVIFNDFIVKAGNFKLDAEIAYVTGDDKTLETGLGQKDFEYDQWLVWIEMGMDFGPASLALGGFFIEGTDPNQTFAAGTSYELASVLGLGAIWEPYLLITSEDMGALWDSAGVANGAPLGGSGFESIYLKATYRISDAMKISGTLAWIQAEEMMRGVDDDLGWELDIGFEWKFMPNLTYRVDAGYWWTGGYFDDVAGAGLDSNDVFGIRHTLRIEW
jgi:hypothetical protein